MAAVMELSPLQQRRVAAVVGGLVADAAAQPLHWIYKEEVMKQVTDGKEEIEFMEPSANPFYRIPTGSHTCYGDQAFTILKSLVESKGLDVKHLVKETYDMFGPNSAYENTENSKYVVGKEDKVNVKTTLPIYTGWRHLSIKHFLENVKLGKEVTGSDSDDQIDSVLRAIPLTALYAGRPDMLSKVEEGLRVTQQSDMAVSMGLVAARILEQYILQGSEANDVIGSIISKMSDAKRDNPQELDNAVVGYIRRVSQVKDIPHSVAVPQTFRKD